MRRAKLRAISMALAFFIIGTSSLSAGEVVTVKITDLAFTPAEITIHAGDSIEWMNDDFIDHTATATDNAWDVVLEVAKSGRREFTHPGTATYFCRVHPDMTGIIHIVSE